MKKTIEERFSNAIAAAERARRDGPRVFLFADEPEAIGREMVTRGLLIVDNEELAQVMGEVETLRAERDRARLVAKGLLGRLGYDRDHPIISELRAEIERWPK